MSSERQELIQIHKLLDSGGSDDKQLEGRSDLELLRSIVDRVKRSDNLLVEDDTLAFPQDTRNKLNSLQTDSLWQQLDKFNDQLRQDYTCRRQMLLRRLDCTVESFKWKGSLGASKKMNDEPAKELRGKAKTMNDQIHECYDKARVTMREEPQISIANLLALRQSDCDKLLNSVVSSSRRTNCKISYNSSNKSRETGGRSEMVNLKQVMIPHVPDRGGRADEIPPPPKENFGHQRGRVGGGGHRHRGGHQRR